MLNNNQAEVNNESKYPEPFESGWMSCGSRTIDSGMNLTLSVDDSGFHLRKECGVISVNDLFGELGWWPTRLAWEGQDASLLGLLGEVAEYVPISQSELLDIVQENIGSYRLNEIEAFIADEQSQEYSPESMKLRCSQLVDDFRIPGLPSDDIDRPGSRYRGLELAFGGEGWSGKLWEPNSCDEIFLPETWDFSTLDAVIKEIPLPRETVLQDLLEADPRWKHFIGIEILQDCKSAETNTSWITPHILENLRQFRRPKSLKYYTRWVSHNDWEKHELVLVVSMSGEVTKDTLVAGKKPTVENRTDYYMHLSNTSITALKTSISNDHKPKWGYGYIVWSVMRTFKEKLEGELAQNGFYLKEG
jgi:hypothetical protein